MSSPTASAQEPGSTGGDAGGVGSPRVPLGTFAALAASGFEIESPDDFLAAMVETAFESSGEAKLHGEAWESVERTIKKRSRVLAAEAGSVHCHATTDALLFGARLGYALARTWPAGLDELDGWLRRAIVRSRAFTDDRLAV